MQKLEKLLKRADFNILLSNVLGKGQAQIIGHKDKVDFTVTFERDAYLDASVSDGPNWRKTLNDLRKVGNEYMGTEPICRFSGSIRAGVLPFDKQTRHYLHWNVQDPEELLRHFANGTGGFAGADVRDVYIFSGKRLEDFIDQELHARHEKQAELHRKYNGIYGKDPVYCDVTRLEAASNLGLFIELSLLTDRHVTSMQKNMKTAMIKAAAPILEIDYAIMATTQEAYYDSLAIDYVACQICDRNGIKHSTPNMFGRLNIVNQKEFQKWCDFYGNYLHEFLSDAELVELLNLYFNDGDISMYEPQGDWRRYKA